VFTDPAMTWEGRRRIRSGGDGAAANHDVDGDTKESCTKQPFADLLKAFRGSGGETVPTWERGVWSRLLIVYARESRGGTVAHGAVFGARLLPRVADALTSGGIGVCPMLLARRGRNLSCTPCV